MLQAGAPKKISFFSHLLISVWFVNQMLLADIRMANLSSREGRAPLPQRNPSGRSSGTAEQCPSPGIVQILFMHTTVRAERILFHFGELSMVALRIEFITGFFTVVKRNDKPVAGKGLPRTPLTGVVEDSVCSSGLHR